LEKLEHVHLADNAGNIEEQPREKEMSNGSLLQGWVLQLE
jgi:hypothetical protein